MNTTEMVTSVQHTLNQEANALQHLSKHVGQEVANAILAIFNCEGRVIVTGVGKSAIVGQKIVATLNSTGTTSLFMHAADAIHGDLGMITNYDILLIISKSGETSEVKALLPLIKGFGNKIIGITSNQSSRLAKESDHTIYLPMEAEADPNNLAPTTSTTLQMAIGDAIAICLLQLRGFTPQQFAKFHPGGNLGKQMYLKVSDMVQYALRPRTYLDDTLEKIIYEISSKRFGATVVLDDNENVIGIITDGDIRRMIEHSQVLTNIKAVDIVNNSPKSCQQSDFAVEALQKMKESKIQQIIVLEGVKYIGLIHLHDFFKEGLY